MKSQTDEPVSMGPAGKALLVALGLLILNVTVLWLFFEFVSDETLKALRNDYEDSTTTYVLLIAFAVVVVEIGGAFRAAWPRGESRNGNGVLVSIFLLPIACLLPLFVLAFALLAHST